MSELITEAAPNLHMDHSDDMLFLYGVDGLRDAINFLRGVRDMLASNTGGRYNVTVKWDGAPAVFAGINPENGKFFVGTKSIFNANPKINYTNADIDKNHGGALADKLKVALQYLPKLGIKNILQGDMMFTSDDLETKNIDGGPHITFQPNTIVYAVPEKSDLAKLIKMAKLGIVFHTSYTGSKMDELSASFGANTKSLNKTSTVWYQNADFKDVSGTATLNSAETKVLTTILSSIGTKFRSLDGRFFDDIARDRSNTGLRMMITTYINSIIRAGGRQRPDVEGLIKFVDMWWEKQKDKVKTEKAKKAKDKQKQDVIAFINRNRKQLTFAFIIHEDLTAAKNIVLRKLEAVQGLTKTFVKDKDGYKVVAPEGFVAISREKGNAVKLVNRLEFSTHNFNVDLKNWK